MPTWRVDFALLWAEEGLEAVPRIKPREKAVRVPGGFPAGLPLWPRGHQVGLPTSARLGFIRVYA